MPPQEYRRTFQVSFPRTKIDNRRQRDILDAITREYVDDTGQWMADRARQFAPIRSGKLRQAIYHKPGRIDGRTHFGVVGIDSDIAPHGIWVEEGTGIFGKNRTPIVPTRSKNLVFRLHKARHYPEGTLMKLPSVLGQPGQHFMRQARQVTVQLYQPVRRAVLKQEIKEAIRLFK